MNQRAFLEFDLEEFLLRLTEPEGYAFEAKEASGNIPASLWPTASAFANSEGGVIVLGLRETEDGWIPQGVSNADALKHDLHTKMRNPQVISREVAGQHEIRIVTFADKKFIAVRIHPVPRNQRPVFIRNDPSAAYLRRDSGDFICTAEELAQMQREASPGPLDRQIIPYLSIDDFDIEAVDRYRVMVKLAAKRGSTRDFLEGIGAYRVDRARGEEGPTFAGILMFGNELAIREIRPNHVIDYRRIPNSGAPRRRWSDRVRWTGHLFGAWEEISPKLARGLPVPFRLEGMRRIDEEAGSESLREAFVNLLVHADYRETADSIILHRDNGYVFTNPGDSRVRTVASTIEFNRSERRNPALADMFGRAGLADRAGSGFVAMFREWSELGFRAPVITSGAAAYEFRLELPLNSLTSAADRTWLESLGGPWTEAEELALLLARADGMVTNARLRAATNKEVLETSRVLIRLRDRGHLTMHGSGKDTFYKLSFGTSLHEESLQPGGGHDVVRSDASLTNSRADLSLSVPSLTNSGADLPLSDPKLTNSDAVESNDAFRDASGAPERPTQIAQSDWEQLLEIARPLRTRKRTPSPVLRDRVVTELCAVAPLSARELHLLIGRDIRLVRRVVRDLVDRRQLRLNLPQAPNHPQQRYVAVIADEDRSESKA